MKSIVYTLLTLVMSGTYVQAKVGGPDKFKTKVAVIDTGFSAFYGTPLSQKMLCKSGHYDFTTMTPNVGYDEIGHGSFVTNLITGNAKRTDICILIYKVDAYVREETRHDITKALIYAFNKGARVTNISMGHPHFSHKEEKVFQRATKRGMKVFASAGNDGRDQNKMCKTFPACYASVREGLYVVGSVDRSGLLETYSNRGSRVHIYEYGSIERVGRGTSFAAPRALARYLRDQNGKSDD